MKREYEWSQGSPVGWALGRPLQDLRQSIPRAGEMKAIVSVNAQPSFLKHLCLDSLCLWGRVPAASPL